MMRKLDVEIINE